MFTIEKPKEIHLKSWKKLINECALTNTFWYNEVDFDLFWNCIFRENFFAYAAKNNDNFMGIVISRINETYYEKNLVLEAVYVAPEFRKLGVARALINRIEAVATEQKLDLIVYGIEKSNLLAQKLFKNYLEITRTRYIKKA